MTSTWLKIEIQMQVRWLAYTNNGDECIVQRIRVEECMRWVWVGVALYWLFARFTQQDLW